MLLSPGDTEPDQLSAFDDVISATMACTTSPPENDSCNCSDDKDIAPASRVHSQDSLAAAAGDGDKTKPSSPDGPKPVKTLQSKSRIPFSMYIVGAVTVGAQYSGGVCSWDVLESLMKSYVTSGRAASAHLRSLRDMCTALATGSGDSYSTAENGLACLCTLSSALILYVLIYAPFRAGMWTGKRASRHKLHRYLGLFFLIQYFAAWVEFITDYENGGKDSYLSHFIGLNGIIQGVSAYFSFKVLPELADPGYYSDKSVLSRTFIHENTYFATIVFLGSCLYHDTIRSNMMAHPLGRIIIFIFTYWNYVVLRPFFPITSFSDAGSREGGRSERNATFYRVGTLMVKIFYLWGKYYLGFFLNWIIYLGLQTDRDMKFVRGLYLANVGTMSISVFLHTLRFKKVLPPTVTFSIYLAQIYGTFLALPYCLDVFLNHERLLLLTTLGLVLNMVMTRRRRRRRHYQRWIHAAWCGLCVYLLECTDIVW